MFLCCLDYFSNFLIPVPSFGYSVSFLTVRIRILYVCEHLWLILTKLIGAAMTRILLSAFLVAFGLSGHVAARCSDAKVGDQFVWARYNDTFIYPLEDPLFNAITPHFSVFESLGVIVNRVTVTNVTLDYMYRVSTLPLVVEFLLRVQHSHKTSFDHSECKDEKFETKGNALNISDVYGNQADEFKGLCEELWACS
jgi:hypothetical protein